MKIPVALSLLLLLAAAAVSPSYGSEGKTRNAPRRRAKNENECDITGRYHYIKTLKTYASEVPLYDVGQVSYDCYDIPDKVFASGSEQDFLTDETVEFLVDAFHHPVLVTGVMTGGICLLNNLFNVELRKERHDREHQLQLKELGYFRSFEIFTGISGLDPFSEQTYRQGVITKSAIGAALTLPVKELAYAADHVDDDACFIGSSALTVAGEETGDEDICLTTCGLEVEPGVIHFWLNEAVPLGGSPQRDLKVNENHEKEANEERGLDQVGIPLFFKKPGFVMHRTYLE